jgi:hypothetical protein
MVAGSAGLIPAVPQAVSSHYPLIISSSQT